MRLRHYDKVEKPVVAVSDLPDVPEEWLEQNRQEIEHAQSLYESVLERFPDCDPQVLIIGSTIGTRSKNRLPYTPGDLDMAIIGIGPERFAILEQEDLFPFNKWDLVETKRLSRTRDGTYYWGFTPDKKARISIAVPGEQVELAQFLSLQTIDQNAYVVNRQNPLGRVLTINAGERLRPEVVPELHIEVAETEKQLMDQLSKIIKWFKAIVLQGRHELYVNEVRNIQTALRNCSEIILNSENPDFLDSYIKGLIDDLLHNPDRRLLTDSKGKRMDVKACTLLESSNLLPTLFPVSYFLSYSCIGVRGDSGATLGEFINEYVIGTLPSYINYALTKGTLWEYWEEILYHIIDWGYDYSRDSLTEQYPEWRADSVYQNHLLMKAIRTKHGFAAQPNISPGAILGMLTISDSLGPNELDEFIQSNLFAKYSRLDGMHQGSTRIRSGILNAVAMHMFFPFYKHHSSGTRYGRVVQLIELSDSDNPLSYREKNDVVRGAFAWI